MNRTYSSSVGDTTGLEGSPTHGGEKRETISFNFPHTVRRRHIVQMLSAYLFRLRGF